MALEPIPLLATQVCSSPTLLRKALSALQVLISYLLLFSALVANGIVFHRVMQHHQTNSLVCRPHRQQPALDNDPCGIA